MKKLFSIFLLAFVANHASDPVGVAAGGASSDVAVKAHDQKNVVSHSQFTSEEKARLRKENQERVKNKLATKQDRTTNLIIVNDYSELFNKEGTRAFRFDIKNALHTNQLVLCTKAIFLASQDLYKSVLPQGYICKEVNDHYLLFIPEAMQNKDKPENLQSELLGLNISGLKDYKYESVDENEITKIIHNAKTALVEDQKPGKILLETLNKLPIKDVSPELLPYFNIYLGGHGRDGIIADISAKSKGPNEPSDFLKIMQIFDKGFRTKSVGLFTCFIGGKQNIDTYGKHDQQGRPVFNKYDNSLLENLSYTIINNGSLYQTTYIGMDFIKYFEYLNNPNGPKYQELLDQARHWSLDNWMSIKLPHTSWFSPVELKNKSQTLSQVAMSTQKTPVDIKESTEVIILQANYIPQPVIFNNFNTTSFMPVNYHDQSYYFKSLISILSDTIFDALQSLIFSNVRVNEEINFAFERLQLGNIVYKNVHCFVSKFDSAQRATTGFVYEDDQGRVFKYTWPAQQPSDMMGIKKTLDLILEDDSVKEEVIAKDVWDKEFKKISESAQKKVSESLRPDFLNRLQQKFSTENKFIVGETLDKIAEQLSKKLLQPQDLEKIVPVLQKEMKSEDISVQKQVGNIFAGLIGTHVITSDNIKILQPLLIELFKDHVENVEKEGLNFIRRLMTNGIITFDNWHLLLPVLKLGSESDLFQTRLSIGSIINAFCLRSVIKSFNDVKLFLEEGINDPDPKVRASYLKVIETLTKKALVTQTDIADFKKLTSYSDVQDAIDKLTEIAPKKLPKRFSLKQSALFSSLTKKITDPDKSVRLSAIQKISASINNNFITNMNIDQFLPIIEKGMLDSDKIIRSNVLAVLYRLISNKLITEANIEQLLSILQKCLSDSDKSIRLEGFNIFMAAIEDGLITEANIHQFLPIIEKGVSDLDQDIRLKLLVILYRAINKNVITNANIEQFLPTIQMCVSDSDKSVRLDAFDIFSNAITQRLITEANIDQFLPLIEKGLSDHDQRVRFKAFKIFGSATFKYKLITKVNIDRILLLIEKGIDSSSSYVNWLIEEFEKLINEDLIAETNIDQFLPLIEKVIKVSPEYERNGLLEMLIDKNLITAESARGLEPLVDDAELKAKLQNQYVNHELEQDKNLHRQELQKDEDRLDYQEQQERENRHRQAPLEHTRVVEVR